MKQTERIDKFLAGLAEQSRLDNAESFVLGRIGAQNDSIPAQKQEDAPKKNVTNKSFAGCEGPNINCRNIGCYTTRNQGCTNRKCLSVGNNTRCTNEDCNCSGTNNSCNNGY